MPSGVRAREAVLGRRCRQLAAAVLGAAGAVLLLGTGRHARQAVLGRALRLDMVRPIESAVAHPKIDRSPSDRSAQWLRPLNRTASARGLATEYSQVRAPAAAETACGRRVVAPAAVAVLAAVHGGRGIPCGTVVALTAALTAIPADTQWSRWALTGGCSQAAGDPRWEADEPEAAQSGSQEARAGSQAVM